MEDAREQAVQEPQEQHNMVTIKGKQYRFEFGNIWGPMYTYELLTQGRVPYDPGNMASNHIMYYGILCRCNEQIDLTFDEYLEALNDVELVKAMTSYYVKRMNVLQQAAKAETAAKEQADRAKWERKRQAAHDRGQKDAEAEAEKWLQRHAERELKKKSQREHTLVAEAGKLPVARTGRPGNFIGRWLAEAVFRLSTSLLRWATARR